MSLLDALLGPRCISADSQSRPRTLQVQRDVLVHLWEDDRREHVTIYSMPGRREADEWVLRLATPWTQALPHPEHPDVQSVLAIEPETGRVFLSSEWPRAALDSVTFEQRLIEHAQWHRRLAATIATGEPDVTVAAPVLGLPYA